MPPEFPGDRPVLRRHLRLAAVLFLALVAASVMGNRSLIRLYQLHQEKQTLQQEIDQMASANGVLAEEVRQFRTDPARVEAIAREELGLVRPGEIVYEFEAPPRGPAPADDRR